MLSDAQLIAQFKKHKQIDESYLESQHAEARESHQFYAGDSMYYTASVEDKGQRKAVSFNKVQPYVNTIVGLMIQMRRKPEYQARIEDNEQQVLFSSNTNSLSDYARDNASLSFLETWQDREMVIAGYGAIDTNVGYEQNPDGEVVGEICDFGDVYWDPEARKPNLIDARWVRRRKAYSKEEVEKRWPKDKPEDFEAYQGDQGTKEYNPNDGEYTDILVNGGKDKDLLQVHYYQWWELQTYWRAMNPVAQIEDPAMKQQFILIMQNMALIRKESLSKDEREDLFEMKPDSEYLSMTPDQKADMQRLCEEFGVELDAIRQLRRCYYTALITNNTVLDKFKSLSQDGFTIKFKTAYFDNIRKVWYGLVRALKNPQEYADKALTEMLFTIASTSKGGVMYEEDAVTDPQRFEQQYASTKAAIPVAANALSGGKIQPKAQAALPTGYENIHAMSDAAMSDVTGIGKEFLGTATAKQVSALLESQRINQVLSTLAAYFDAITLYQIEHARLMLTYLRILAENSAGRLIRIIGEDGATNYKRLNVSMLADEYDVVIGEAPITPAQKERTTDIMMGMADKLAAMGTNIYPVAINYLPIQAQDKQKLLKALTPSPEAESAKAQAAAKQAQLEEQMNQVIAQGTMAKAARDMAEAELKKASLPKIVAEADETRADTAKTLEEVASIAAQTEALRQNGAGSVSVTL
jgi:hypothetical protein